MSEIVVTRNDLGHTVQAHTNDVVVVNLDENLTTGYSWEVNPVDSSVVELIESTHQASPQTALGQSGSRVVRFVAKSPGSQQIRLQLRRPWDPPDVDLEDLAVTVQVRP